MSNKPMKTLTIGSTTYDIVDTTAREGLNSIPTKVSELTNDSGYITDSVNHFSVGTRFTISSDDSNRRTDITAYSEAGDNLNLTAYNLNVNASVVRIEPTQTYIQNVVDPTDSGDAANKAYVDSAIASAITATLSTAV